MISLVNILIVLCVALGSGIIMPMTKTDGTLDVSSLLSHIALLEQSIEDKASAVEVAQLKSDLATSQKELADTKTKLAQVETKLDTSVKDITRLESELADTKTTLTQVETKLATTTDELNKLKSDQDQEMKDVKSDVKKAEIELAVLQNQLLNQNNTASSGASPSIRNLTLEMANLKTEVVQLKYTQNKTVSGGASFIRWGRTSCPAESNIVYKGYTGGTGYADGASSASIVCLPDQPIYGKHAATGFNTQISNLWGTEYQIDYDGAPFRNLLNDDMPCAFCESKSRSSMMMIPARNACYSGWTLEYSGYLLGPAYKHASGEYICVDANAEAIPGGHDNKDGQLLYPVQGICGSLPCPPYQNFWELTCVVCSK